MTYSPRRPLRRPASIHLAEWMKAKGFIDETLARQLGVERSTVTRYRLQSRYLTIPKLFEIARVLGINPIQLFHLPPGRESIDALLHDADDASHDVVLNLTKKLGRKPLL